MQTLDIPSLEIAGRDMAVHVNGAAYHQAKSKWSAAIKAGKPSEAADTVAELTRKGKVKEAMAALAAFSKPEDLSVRGDVSLIGPQLQSEFEQLSDQLTKAEEENMRLRDEIASLRLVKSLQPVNLINLPTDNKFVYMEVGPGGSLTCRPKGGK